MRWLLVPLLGLVFGLGVAAPGSAQDAGDEDARAADARAADGPAADARAADGPAADARAADARAADGPAADARAADARAGDARAADDPDARPADARLARWTAEMGGPSFPGPRRGDLLLPDRDLRCAGHGPGCPPSPRSQRPAVRALRTRMMACYETSLLGRQIVGAVHVEVTVAPSGRVARAAVLSNQTGDEALGACLARALEGTRLDRSDRTWTFVMPIVFAPRPAAARPAAARPAAARPAAARPVAARPVAPRRPPPARAR